MSADRTDDDTWDLATSVGATATMVAAGRARATRANLLDDRYAEPLVRAVGVDFFTRWATGELAAADGDVPGSFWGMQQTTTCSPRAPGTSTPSSPMRPMPPSVRW